MPGVHAVFTAADMPARIATGQIPMLVPNPAIRTPRTQIALARDEVCYVGQTIAVVVADSRHLAEDGILIVTLTVDRETATVRAGPDLTSRGVIEPELSSKLMADAREAAIASIARLADTHADINTLREVIHDAVSQTVWKKTRRRPMIIPVVLEI